MQITYLWIPSCPIWHDFVRGFGLDHPPMINTVVFSYLNILLLDIPTDSKRFKKWCPDMASGWEKPKHHDIAFSLDHPGILPPELCQCLIINNVYTSYVYIYMCVCVHCNVFSLNGSWRELANISWAYPLILSFAPLSWPQNVDPDSPNIGSWIWWSPGELLPDAEAESLSPGRDAFLGSSMKMATVQGLFIVSGRFIRVYIYIIYTYYF